MSFYSPSKQYSNRPLHSNYEDEVQTKVNILRKEFLEMDVNHLEYLTKVELYNLLDNKIGRAFDREVADQLYSRMNKDYQGKVTIDDFIKVFLEAEEILKSKIQNTRNALEDIYRTRKEYNSKLEEVRTTEVLNNFGVMQNSYLNVVVISGNNLGINGQTTPFVTMNFGDQKFETGISGQNISQTHQWQNSQHKLQNNLNILSINI